MRLGILHIVYKRGGLSWRELKARIMLRRGKKMKTL
jgi:hypothetical protein